MSGSVITVTEDNSGWFVDAGERLGPYISKRRAMDIAEGLAWGNSLIGKRVEVRLEERSWGPKIDPAAFRRRTQGAA